MANKKFESDIIVNGAIAKVGGLATQFLKANGTIDANIYEVAFTKNTAFNKNFGTTTTTVAEGNDFRILNGQTAFTWGNHAGLYSLVSHTHTFASLTSKPTTLAGYGITDFNSSGDVRWAPLVSPAFTGVPTAPTASQNTNTGQVATTAFVKAAIISNPRMKDIIIATAGQTIFYSGVPYTVGSVEVYFNGSKLAPSEYTAVNNTSITIAAAALGSVIELNYGTIAVQSVIDNSLSMVSAMLFN